MKHLLRRSMLMALCAVGAGQTLASPSLEDGFAHPPAEARPRTWWHWMNGNVTADGVVKDLDWMARVGLGGVQNFDANLATPQVVERRLAYMTPEWKQVFRTAVDHAESLGLEFAIASSPGWSETGGPWVPPEDGLKKLVWSEVVVGSDSGAITLPAPPTVSGPFQGIQAQDPTAGLQAGPVFKAPETYRDVAVLAFPEPATPTASSSHLRPNWVTRSRRTHRSGWSTTARWVRRDIQGLSPNARMSPTWSWTTHCREKSTSTWGSERDFIAQVTAGSPS